MVLPPASFEPRNPFFLNKIFCISKQKTETESKACEGGPVLEPQSPGGPVCQPTRLALTWPDTRKPQRAAQPDPKL